jgi:hypothetical protein
MVKLCRLSTLALDDQFYKFNLGYQHDSPGSYLSLVGDENSRSGAEVISK